MADSNSNKELRKIWIAVPFTFYFIKLHLRILLGLHHTANPINLKWRWNYWKRKHGILLKHN